MKISRIVRPLVAGGVAAGLLVGSAQAAHADSWHTYLDQVPKPEGQPGYSKEAPMSSANGVSYGGRGWDLVTHVWIENENYHRLASATGSGWSVVTVTIPRQPAVYAGCNWTSASQSGSDKIGMTCKYYGGAAIIGRESAPSTVAQLKATHRPRVARLVREVDVTGIGVGGLDVASLRFAGSVDGVTYFRGRAEGGQSCLVGWTAPERVAGSACAPQRRIAHFGPLRLQLGVSGLERRGVTVSGARVAAF